MARPGSGTFRHPRGIQRWGLCRVWGNTFHCIYLPFLRVMSMTGNHVAAQRSAAWFVPVWDLW